MFYFNSNVIEITKLSNEKADDQFDCESSINVSGHKIRVFEQPRDTIYINHIDNARHRDIARELREAVRQSKLDFALDPYKEYLNLPEIDYFKKKGQLENTQTSITIRHCSLILAFGIKKLIDDINSNTLVPRSKMTMEEDYRIVQPRVKLLSYKNRRHQQEYDYMKRKFKESKRSIHRLYNSTIFLKYNAIRYFYHVNSYHRD